MSTVLEVIAARARGLRVLGISTITNLAAGVGTQPLNHEEVLEAGRAIADDLEVLVRGVLRGL
jgi:purine-nucleoside phosphorylase